VLDEASVPFMRPDDIICLVQTKQNERQGLKMESEIVKAKENFVQGMSRISHFWGFPKAMGAIFGAVYLSPGAISLDELVQQVGVTKGSVSTNIRTLERLGMVHKQIQVGDRKDYYVAETDFWKIVRGVLREREKNEFDQALRTVGESLAMVDNAADEEAELAGFYRERMGALQAFFNRLDKLVATLMALEDLRQGSMQRIFTSSSDKKE
jgi:DNA-binding transcriptional regulator GbsR (MarR family)